MNDAADEADEDLMLAYAAGDASAFTRLYDRHERAVHRYFRRQGVAAQQADDLLQETWMAILRSAARYTVEARFTTLLYLIAHRKLIDHWRAKKQQVLLDDAADDPDGDADGTPWIESIADGDAARPDVRAMSRQQAEAFIAAVGHLPAAQRAAFLLHIDGELTMEQMAAVTRVGIETLKSRLRYATKRVRLACADWLEPRATESAGERDAS
ncbi:MAG: sigma-70 family RNA polymerase sigma factor [Burkholderiaceae bacterium]